MKITHLFKSLSILISTIGISVSNPVAPLSNIRAFRTTASDTIPPVSPRIEPEIICYFGTREEMPIFPGCENVERRNRHQCTGESLREYVFGNFKSPEITNGEIFSGLIVVRFCILSDGTIDEIELLRGTGNPSGEELVRVMETMKESLGKWTPGKQFGKPVKVYYNFPFKLSTV